MTAPAQGESKAPTTPPAAAPPRDLRVAFCIDNMNVGGTELNALRVAKHLLAQGVELRVFTLSRGGPLLDCYAKLGVPVHVLPIASLYSPAALKGGRELAARIRRHRIDVVHAHDFYSNIFAAPWARLAGAGFIASRRWWEGPDRVSQRWANRASYLLAHRILANSASVAELLVKRERVRRTSVVVVPNFLDEEAFAAPPSGWTGAFARELDLPEKRVVVGVVASLSPIKDHATLLRAMAALSSDWPDLHLVLVGRDAGCLQSLEQLAATLGIPNRVHFAGARPNQPSPHYLFDISVLSSVSEGMPNSVLEAMAAGRPVVATSVGAVKDAVVEGTGFLVPPGDVPALQARLQQLLGDPALRGRLGAAGRRRAENEYSAPAAIGPLLETYQDLARRTR